MFFCVKPPVTSRVLSDRSSPTILPKASTTSLLDSPRVPGPGHALEGKGGVHVFNFVYIAEEKYGNEENREDHRKKSKEAGEGEKKSAPKG